MSSDETRFPQVRAVSASVDVLLGLEESGVVGTWFGPALPDLAIRDPPWQSESLTPECRWGSTTVC